MKTKYAVITFLFAILLTQGVSLAQETSFDVYFFWGDGCPHCAAQEPFMEELIQKYPQIKLHSYETWYNQSNALLLRDMVKEWNVTLLGVPATFVGDYPPVIGFDSESVTGKKIEELVQKCLEDSCYNSENASNQINIVNIPLIGEIDLREPSLPVLTIMLGFADGFNPCAFFILYSLLSLLVYAGSRKKMLMIGGIFVLFSAVIYFFMIAVWIEVLSTIALSSRVYIAIIAGLIALVVASVNIKDFFFFKKGVSFTISEDAKIKIFSRMRKLLKAESMIAMLIGTIVLAVLVNMYELACTFGFPSFFAQELVRRGVETQSKYLYNLLYCTVYIIPLLSIVLSFTIARGSRKLSESSGRKLKLISGLMMLLLGLSLLFYPSVLENPLLSITMLVSAVVAALIIAKITDKKRGITKEQFDKEENKKEGEEDE